MRICGARAHLSHVHVRRWTTWHGERGGIACFLPLDLRSAAWEVRATDEVDAGVHGGTTDGADGVCSSRTCRFEADPEVLAKYVVTLLRTEEAGSDAELHEKCEEQLEEFLGEHTKAFVAETIARLRRGDPPPRENERERTYERKDGRGSHKREREVDLRDTLRTSKENRRSPERRRQRRETAYTTLRLTGVPAEVNAPPSLFKHFRKFGLVVKIQCRDGQGVAFVQMKTREQARSALNAPDAVLGNRFIRLDWAQRDILTPEEVDEWEKDRETNRAKKQQEQKEALLEQLQKKRQLLEQKQLKQKKQFLAKQKGQEHANANIGAPKRTFHLDHRPKSFKVVHAPEKVSDFKILRNHFAGLAGFMNCTMAEGNKLPARIEFVTRRTAEAAIVQGNKIGAFPLKLEWVQAAEGDASTEKDANVGDAAPTEKLAQSSAMNSPAVQ